jgi:hypothetical protein
MIERHWDRRATPLAIAAIVLLAAALAGCAGARTDPPAGQGGSAPESLNAPSDPYHYHMRFQAGY